MQDFKIDKKQRNLLINSESPKVLPWFNELLRKYEKLNLVNVPEQYHDDFKHVIPHLLKQCGEEWKSDESVLYPVEDLGKPSKRCSLCNTRNRYIYYIQNRLNGKKLNVGRDCVQEFSDFDFLKNGKSQSQLIKEAKKIRRRSIINRKFPNIDNELDKWENHLDTYYVLIPTYLAKPYRHLGQDTRQLFDDFLNEKGDDTTFRKIREMLRKKEELIRAMDLYNEKNKDDKFIATMQMKRKLERLNDQATLEKLSEVGWVDETTIGKVIEPEFLSKVYQDVQSLLNGIEIGVEAYPPEPEYYLLTPKKHNNSIHLLCKQEKIFLNFGSCFFGKQSKARLSLKNIVRISDFADNASVVNFVTELNYLSRRSGIRLVQTVENEIDIEFENRILPYNLKNFLHEFKTEIYEEEFNVERYKQLIKSLEGKRYTREVLNDLRGIRTSLNSRYKSLDDDELEIGM